MAPCLQEKYFLAIGFGTANVVKSEHIRGKNIIIMKPSVFIQWLKTTMNKSVGVHYVVCCHLVKGLETIVLEYVHHLKYCQISVT